MALRKRKPARDKKPTAARNAGANTGAAPDALQEYAASAFPVVGVGASAGGVEALSELLRSLPAAPGAAVVIVTHQEKKHVSHLSEVLARTTSLPVEVVKDTSPIEADHIYVAPPDGQLVAVDGALRIVHDDGSLPIDGFLRSLAEDQGSRAIAVILSGSASDGTLGTRAVKAEGGITFAQDESARFDSMPGSAVASGSIDFVIPPREIAKEIVRIARSAIVRVGVPGRFPEAQMRKVFEVLRTAHEVDFTHYKPTTVERRIRRRMTLHRTESLQDYIKILEDNPAEVEQLYGDILIRVTGFFRDAQVFEILRRDIFPRLLADRDNGNPLRVWVPGCATGEEAYSLAMAIMETAGAGFASPVQIFATDVSEIAIDYARSGIYPETVLGEISPERMRRFFTKMENGYRVAKAVRDCCVFARQNLTKDPPFSNIDLISCRNVMIYLGSMLQRKVMAIFHYALRPDGYLLLGSSETIGNFSELFSAADRKHKIYQKRAGSARVSVDFDLGTARERSEGREPPPREEELGSGRNLFREADRVILARFSPPGVLINEQMDILQFRGRTGTFLEPAPGAATLNVLKMAREGLLAELRAAILSARKSDAPVRRENIRVHADGEIVLANVEVIPFVSPTRERLQIVLFEQIPVPPAPRRGAKGDKGKKAKGDSSEVERLKRELDATREYLQSIIEEQEAMNEELRSANEETQSSNEELQSTNEELETAKEELQSTNEELTTLNEELETRNQEMAAAANDLLNLLSSVDIPIVMLDSALRIRRFNPFAQHVLNLIPADVGRSLNDMKTSLDLEDLPRMVESVIDTLETREMEVRDRGGHRYLLRIRPYKTTENKIDGAVLVLIDIQNLKK